MRNNNLDFALLVYTCACNEWFFVYYYNWFSGLWEFCVGFCTTEGIESHLKVVYFHLIKFMVKAPQTVVFSIFIVPLKYKSSSLAIQKYGQRPDKFYIIWFAIGSVHIERYILDYFIA